MGAEQRKYPRLALNAFIRFYQEPSNRTLPKYRQGIVKNYSHGGMFISTNHLFPKGSILILEIPIESETEKLTIVEVRGVVRWLGTRGIGIEFFEFKESHAQNFAAWVENLIA
jgi:Tfp pilus assembly protein PilZ